MKEKHLYILGGVFLALFIIYFLTKPRMHSVNYDDVVQTILFGFEKEDVAGIEIYKQTSGGEARLELVKVEDQWRIPTTYNAKVRTYSVDKIIDDLLEMTGKVRSSDAKHLDMFQISDEQGVHVILKDEAQNPLANLIVGKKGEDYNSGFIRFSGKEKIYGVDKNILSSVGVYGEIDTLSKFNAKSFIDLNAVKLDKDKLNLAALVANGREMVIRKVEKKSEEASAEDSTAVARPVEYEWVYMKGDKEIALDQKEVDNFFRDVTSIYAQEVVDQMGNSLADLNKSSQYRFNRPSHYIVFINEEDDAKKNIIFGKEYEKDKGYYMQVQYDNLVYKVNKSKFDTIFKWATDLPTKLPKKEES